MSAVYNELEPYPSQWLRNLADAGHIARGPVLEGSIKDLSPWMVKAHTQAHFFAGLGGWSYALRLAGWPDSRPVWTGSCPCQPFSTAGKAKGFDDERHLWPTWFNLIRECRPPIVFGEQVASKDGRAWLDLVSADLEREGYTFGAADLCAAGAGAPHLRQRLYFVAFSARIGLQGWRDGGRGVQGESHGLFPGGPGQPGPPQGHVGHASGHGGGWHPGGLRGTQGGSPGEWAHPGTNLDQPFTPGPAGGPWANCEWLPCSDGKARPVEPGTFPLADGVPQRMGRVRAYGNAIVPQVAAAFVRSVMDLVG